MEVLFQREPVPVLPSYSLGSEGKDFGRFVRATNAVTTKPHKCPIHRGPKVDRASLSLRVSFPFAKLTGRRKKKIYLILYFIFVRKGGRKERKREYYRNI